MLGKYNSQKTKYRTCSFQQKKELGSMAIDELSCFLVMGFIFVMLLIYIGYSKVVQTRLAIDNIAKEYLYQMEQVGYLSNEMERLMTEDLELIGIDTVNFSGTLHKESNQAAYGDIVTLNCVVTFDNPLYTLFPINGIDEKNTYTINMSATAKW